MSNAAPAPVKDGTPPEIPDAVVRRPKTALTPYAAEEIRKENRGAEVPILGEHGFTGGKAKPKAAGKTKPKAMAGKPVYKLRANPLQGMTSAQVDEVRGRTYPGMPKGDGQLGDLDPKIIDWLWEKHPADAEIRYAYRHPAPDWIRNAQKKA